MTPIQDLLNRIRWDKEFGQGEFEIGYYDHVREEIIRVSLREVRFEHGNSFSFDLLTSDGELISIPFHRIREVRKEGAPIWSRPDRRRDS